MNNIAVVNYEGWELVVNYETILIKKDGEHRTYDLNDIIKVKHDENYPEYVYLNREDGSFYQLKFEVDNFLVIDLYDNRGEHIDSVGSHVFDEE